MRLPLRLESVARRIKAAGPEAVSRWALAGELVLVTMVVDEYDEIANGLLESLSPDTLAPIQASKPTS